MRESCPLLRSSPQPARPLRWVGGHGKKGQVGNINDPFFFFKSAQPPPPPPALREGRELEGHGWDKGRCVGDPRSPLVHGAFPMETGELRHPTHTRLQLQRGQERGPIGPPMTAAWLTCFSPTPPSPGVEVVMWVPFFCKASNHLSSWGLCV